MRFALTLLLAAVLLFPLTASAVDVSGDQWGTWIRENSPYNVVGEIRVPPESTLAIEPGIVVNFQGHYKFIVDSLATLLAVGTETDSIYFTAADSAAGWHGIRFMAATSNSQVSYCRIEYGKAAWPDHRGGGILCRFSSPTITNNTIWKNWAATDGGGIYSWYSSPTIVGNLITRNSVVEAGGAIYIRYGDSSTVKNNIITENSALWGGGIFCRGSRSLISENLVKNNSAIGNGGGVTLISTGRPVIQHNIVSGNSSDNSGGGIRCSPESNPTIAGNLISGNSAAFQGGGISCDSTEVVLVNNTISENEAQVSGGGISCRTACTVTMANCILWASAAPNDPEIEVDLGSDLTVSYSDVQGGWAGEGNIDADPIFMGPEKEDFYLRWRSRCIDTGDPFLTDPDGTRSDMGAFYFNQAVNGIVELYPRDTPIVIPPEGGDITYDGWVFNFLGQAGRADIWTYAFVPQMGRYGPTDLYQNIRIHADSLGMNQITEHVPAAAPKGDYVFVAYVGDYPSSIIDSSYFYFSKSGSVAGEMVYWFDGEDWFKESDLAESNVPIDYALSQNYPNPFNAITVIDYQLANADHVRLEVFNLMGESVVTLVNEIQQAGYRSIVWDASGVSSGIYFYRLTAGDFTETKRLMLVK